MWAPARLNERRGRKGQRAGRAERRRRESSRARFTEPVCLVQASPVVTPRAPGPAEPWRSVTPQRQVPSSEPSKYRDVGVPMAVTPRTGPAVTWVAPAQAVPGSEPSRYREVPVPARATLPVTWRAAPTATWVPSSTPCRYRELTIPAAASPTVTWCTAAPPPPQVPQATLATLKNPLEAPPESNVQVAPAPAASTPAASTPPAPVEMSAASPRSVGPSKVTKVTVYPPVRMESSARSDDDRPLTRASGYATPRPAANVVWSTPPVPCQASPPRFHSGPVQSARPWTPMAPVNLPAKVTVKCAPANCVLLPDSPEVTESPRTVLSPQVPMQLAPMVTDACGSPPRSTLEERLKELERRLDAKESECKLLEQHLTEVRGCLEEQKQRGASDLQQRDQHIMES
ncbi:unnamed protein product [Effrenium voratum]|uniref:Uncharacterized protein n=1 Tax=Effrenium voratum TaxID=2562239 RepID=A0AA36N8M8_9DINO|nr:unnamed protein product [Effrenium voratum]